MWERALFPFGSESEARQFCRLLQMFAAQLEPSQALEVPWVFPEFVPGAVYQTGDYLRWGTNAVGDPQLYQVTLDHRASGHLPPERTPELYEPIGTDREGNEIKLYDIIETDEIDVPEKIHLNENIQKHIFRPR